MADERRTAAKKRREQQVKRQKMIIAIVAILAVTVIFIYIVKTHGKEKEGNEATVETSISVKNGENKAPTETSKEPKETSQERLKRVKKEAKHAGYPESVIELLSKNPETVGFVENYGEKKESEPVKKITELEEGKIPQLLQWDERWGYAPYGTNYVATSGCGPTCLSMVFSGLTGDATITPAKMAAYGTENHYVTEENDTTWAFMSEACREWGISCKEILWDEEELKQELKAGHPIICSVGPGDFTEIGHFIVLAGYENGKVIVHDPFSQKNSDKRWEYEKFKDHIKAMWTYSKD